MILVLKSLRLGLVSLVPNFVPAAMAFGLWGYLVGHLGLSASVVTAMAFGIIVDDTIHFLSKYRKARLEGAAAPEAIRSTFRTVGLALATTTVVLAAGFLVFASSGFEISWVNGLLVSSTILFALLADFLLLRAALLMRGMPPRAALLMRGMPPRAPLFMREVPPRAPHRRCFCSDPAWPC